MLTQEVIETRQAQAEMFAKKFKLGPVRIEVEDDKTRIFVEEKYESVEKVRQLHQEIGFAACGIDYDTTTSSIQIHYVMRNPHIQWIDPDAYQDRSLLMICRLAENLELIGIQKDLRDEKAEQPFVLMQALAAALVKQPPVTYLMIVNPSLSLDDIREVEYLICGDPIKQKPANNSLLCMTNLKPEQSMSEEEKEAFNQVWKKIWDKIKENNDMAMKKLLESQGYQAGVAFVAAAERANNLHYFKEVFGQTDLTSLIARFAFGAKPSFPGEQLEDNPMVKAFTVINQKKPNKLKYFQDVVNQQQKNKDHELNQEPKDKTGKGPSSRF